MKLLDVYKSILEAAAFTVDKDGYVSINNELFVGAPNEPATMGGKRIVLPTDEHLRNPSVDSKIIFHPLREQAMKGESEIVAKLRGALTIRLNFAIGALMSELLGIAAEVGKHKKLSPDQSEMLIAGKDVTEDTQVTFSDLLMRIYDGTASKGFVTLYLKKSGVVDTVSYFRVGVVSFPFYEELLKEDQDKYYGITLTKKTRLTLLRMFEYVIPGIATPNLYNKGSNSAVAPIMDSLMRAFGGVASRVNDKIELFKDVFTEPGGEKLIIPCEWEEAFIDLDQLRPQIHMVPQQVGNEGQVGVLAQPSQTTMPVITNHQAVPQSGISSFLQQLTQPQQQQPPMLMGQPIYQPQQQPHAQQLQPPPLEHTATGGVTFQSLLRNLPQSTQVAAAGVGNMFHAPANPFGMVRTDPNAPRSSGGAQMLNNGFGGGLPMVGQNNMPQGGVMINGVLMVPVNTQIAGGHMPNRV